ncbi:MAG: proline--tRNA ligase, partial [Spirochaetales bacterium]|nr:proline--tRNA ligase [Spirochaetales bacterium]
DVDVIYDDRNVSAGIKLNDADLIGSPVRVTIGARSIANGGAEVSLDGGESTIVPLDSVMTYLKDNKVY